MNFLIKICDIAIIPSVNRFFSVASPKVNQQVWHPMYKTYTSETIAPLTRYHLVHQIFHRGKHNAQRRAISFTCPFSDFQFKDSARRKEEMAFSR